MCSHNHELQPGMLFSTPTSQSIFSIQPSSPTYATVKLVPSKTFEVMEYHQLHIYTRPISQALRASSRERLDQMLKLVGLRSLWGSGRGDTGA